MAEWSFLTHHAQALLVIADDPQARLRDVADRLAITERTAFGIVTNLTESGYVIKEKDGRRNRYHVRGELPVPGTSRRDLTISALLALLVDHEAPADAPAEPKPSAPQRAARGRR